MMMMILCTKLDLDETKNVPSRFLKKFSFSKFCHFNLQIKFLAIFFETVDVFASFWSPVLALFGQKYIACGDIR